MLADPASPSSECHRPSVCHYGTLLHAGLRNSGISRLLERADWYPGVLAIFTDADARAHVISAQCRRTPVGSEAGRFSFWQREFAEGIEQVLKVCRILVGLVRGVWEQ